MMHSTVNVELDVSDQNPTVGEVQVFIDRVRECGATDDTIIDVETASLSVEL